MRADLPSGSVLNSLYKLLGDFAVLLHAGMSVKAALFYNTLSSILCAAGMVLGVLLGSMPAVNLWLFLITAGMFIYIALVDMVCCILLIFGCSSWSDLLIT